ncbi:MAG: PEP-CTERM sorting domain-containing protein [Planctomycetaceae bacterium]|nr:PEP-CTERM sorting domain-containing protein [Planctomycetaceae bacterium]
MPRFFLKAFSLWLAALACLLAAPAGAVSIDMVTVGNAGNGTDTSGRPNTFGFGSVAYDYQIGKYNVTIGQYTEFLNAVAKTDFHTSSGPLYAPEMGTDLNIAGISRTGSSGSYTYSLLGSPNRPITYVTWWSAAKFSNWMANGQPTGAQTSQTTENGAYNVEGLWAYAVAKNATNPNTGAAPTFFIPNENEWYKAAYYSPSLNDGAGGYYAYATQSNTAPGNVVGSSPNQANYFNGVYSVTQSFYHEWQNYVSYGGAYSNSGSFYGTFDQSGNVYQWNDLDGAYGPDRGLRGGGWANDAFSISSSSNGSRSTELGNASIGFRLASPTVFFGVPEIDPNGLSAVLGLLAGGLGLLERRRYGR